MKEKLEMSKLGMKLDPSEFISIVETIYSSEDSNDNPFDCDPGNISDSNSDVPIPNRQDYMTKENLKKDSGQLQIPILQASLNKLPYVSKWQNKEENGDLSSHYRQIKNNDNIVLKQNHTDAVNYKYNEIPAPKSSLSFLSRLTDGRKFPCDQCPFRSRYKGDLKRHRLIHSNAFPFACDMCDFKCKSGGSLRRHRMIHFDVMPFACSQCEMKFRRLDALKSHSVIHQREKPFTCNVCAFACKQSQALAKHKLIHSSHKLFACGICSFKCNDRRVMKRHEVSHEKLPFFCLWCNRKFKVLQSLAKHKLVCRKRLYADSN